MKKIVLLFAILGFTGLTYANDPLNNTLWKTVDESTKQAKALVKFTEQKNGTLTATIQSVLTPGEQEVCTKCKGTYHNKSLKNLTIINNLTPVGNADYDNGTILDPSSGKTYSLKAHLAENGKTLELRGFVGFSLLGRTQVWQRVN